MNKKLLFLSLLVVAGTFACQAAFAGNAVLSIDPSTLNITSGNIFNASLKIDSVGNKVCVVSGTLNFENIFCQSIQVAGSVMAQKTPTCQEPSFVLGIPKCNSSLQALLAISAKIGSVGQGNITLNNAKVIGAGQDTPFDQSNGSYTITQTIQPPQTQVQQKIQDSFQAEELLAEVQPQKINLQNNSAPENTNVGLAGLLNSSPIFKYFGIALIIILAAGIIYYSRRAIKAKENK